jgi:hypothetical protein
MSEQEKIFKKATNSEFFRYAARSCCIRLLHMKPRILPIDISHPDLVDELVHTSSLLRAYPFLAPQATEFEQLLPVWFGLMQSEILLVRERRQTEARAVAVDDVFNYLCSALSSTVMAENGNDRDAPLYQRFFGGTSPSKLKRPVLGEQLAVMRTWVPALIAPQSSPALQAYGSQLAEGVIEADQAVLAMSEAERKQADFEVGPRKAFIDDLNAMRQLLFGQLAEIPIRQPERNLPIDFAHRFFLRRSSPRKPTIPGVEQKILRLRERLRKQEELLAALIEEAESEARLREDAEVAEVEAELAALQQQQAATAERLAALKAQRRTSATLQK